MKKYKQLNHEERITIKVCLWYKMSIRQIAEKMKRSPSTISSEIKRGITIDGTYFAESTERLVRQRKLNDKDNENNLKFFKCGTEINGKAYRIQYNFIDNKLWINTWNDYGEYYFENSDNFPDVLKRFIKSFFRYIRKTTKNDITKFYT